jgi:bacillithiol biosynthesis cysteine-adding enzyme BshC
VIDPAAEGSASFLDRYRAGDLAPFFARPPGDLDAGLDRPPLDDPDGLAAALAVQARARGDRPGQLEAIERLRDPAARAIVTGQQAGLLLGPTFTLSKAITALQLARRLDRPERPVVAVFWVASQDHDAAEIDHAYLLDGDERLQRLALPFPEELPAGRAPWLAAWTERLDARLAQLAPHASGAPARELARAAYAHADTVADGFARLLSSLLGDQGLIVLDPMRPDVARRFAPVLHGDLRHPLAGPDAIRRAGTELRARGLRPQLGRGEDATNLFVQEAPDAPRKLLRFDGRRFHPDGSPASRWTRGDLEARLADDPLAITPAAGLRPVVQDAALPTAAIVVGPGELRYFAQLRGVYEHHEVPMPTVWPRAFATILEPPVARILARHGVRAADVAADPEGVLRERLLSLHGQAERFAAARERLEGDVAELLEATSDLDPTLAGPVRRGRRALDLTLCRLRIKAADALARRDRTTSAQFARLRAHLLPDGRPQERVLSPFSHFAKFGVDPVMARLRTLEPEGAQELAIDP